MTKQAAGPYAIHFDRFVPVKFLQYWVLVLEAPMRGCWSGWPKFILPASPRLRWEASSSGSGGRAPLPAFFLLWFVFTIAPILPLGQFQTLLPDGRFDRPCDARGGRDCLGGRSRARWRWAWRSSRPRSPSPSTD